MYYEMFHQKHARDTKNQNNNLIVPAESVICVVVTLVRLNLYLYLATKGTRETHFHVQEK